MRRRLGELFRFGIVGALATLTHFMVLVALVEHVYMQPTLANGAAFLCAVSVTYLGQSVWVFSGHGSINLVKLLRFSVSLAIGFAVNISIMALATEILGLGYRIGFLIACLLVPMLSFIINKLWVFRNVSA